jgi:DNA-binding Xre family transcriptional regulator
MNVVKVTIKEMAQKRGLTTAYQLQKVTGVQPNLAAKWYRNDLKSIAIDSLNVLCNALKCEPSDLLTFTPDNISLEK